MGTGLVDSEKHQKNKEKKWELHINTKDLHITEEKKTGPVKYSNSFFLQIVTEYPGCSRHGDFRDVKTAILALK